MRLPMLSLMVDNVILLSLWAVDSHALRDMS